MAQATNILIKDDANPLVEQTFVPITGGRPIWRTQLTGIPLQGQHTIEALVNEILKSGDNRRVLRTTTKVMETLGASGTALGYVAPQKVAYQIPVTTTILVPYRATQADIANALKMHLVGMLGASSTTATGTLNGASAADAWKSGTGPLTRYMIYGEDAF